MTCHIDHFAYFKPITSKSTHPTYPTPHPTPVLQTHEWSCNKFTVDCGTAAQRQIISTPKQKFALSGRVFLERLKKHTKPQIKNTFTTALHRCEFVQLKIKRHIILRTQRTVSVHAVKSICNWALHKEYIRNNWTYTLGHRCYALRSLQRQRQQTRNAVVRRSTHTDARAQNVWPPSVQKEKHRKHFSQIHHRSKRWTKKEKSSLLVVAVVELDTEYYKL